MKKSIKYGLYALITILFFTFMGSFYVLQENEQAIVLQFGKVVGTPVTDAGLHFKTPFIQSIRTFDKRVLEWDGEAKQVPTSDKKYIFVDTFARWRIIDPIKYYQSTGGSETIAQSRLDDIIDSATKAKVSGLPLLEAVRNSNREMESALDATDSTGAQLDVVIQEIEAGREQLQDLILEKAETGVGEFGIELRDVRIKKVNYIESTRKKVYERMISERNRIAAKFRSEGKGRKAEIDGQREKEYKRITSEAYRQAEQIKGKADAEATKIYADALKKDPEFYSFLESMKAYPHMFSENDEIILKTDSDLLKYFKDAGIK